MARKFLVAIDLNKNELQNSVLQNLATAPSAPVEGQQYYDTVAKKQMTWNGTEWVSAQAGTVTAVTATAPVLSTGGSTPVISIPAATNLAPGHATAAHIAAIEANTAKVTNATHTGDVTGASALTIANNAVSLAKMADMATASILGRNTAGTGDPEVLAISTVKTMLGLNSAAYTPSTDYAAAIHAARHKSGGADAIKLNELAAPTAAVDLNSQKITSLAAPTAGTDAATKDYVDSARAGLSVKDAARVATTANITLSGTQTIDGIAVVAGDRVLVKNQTTPSENGIYVAAAGAWARASDNDTSADMATGTAVWVSEGTANADSRWVLSTNAPITLGTTALTFVKDFQASDIVAGSGLTKNGNQLDAVGTANRITVNADSIDIASTYAGQTSITTVGTIVAGVWNGSDIPVAAGGTGASDAATARTNLGLGTMATQAASAVSITGGTIAGITDLAVADGGTGASTAANACINLGAMRRFAADSVVAAAGAATTYTHSLNSLDVIVAIYDKATGADVESEIVRTSVNAITFKSDSAVTAGQYRIVVMG